MLHDLPSSPAGAAAYQQQHQQLLENPFLRDFVLEGRGVIFYAADLPFQSQDSLALARIARTFPATLSQIDFWPLLTIFRRRFEESQIRRFCQVYLALRAEEEKELPEEPPPAELSTALPAFVDQMIRHLSGGTPPEYAPFILPDQGPILILGAPELFLPYAQEYKFEPEGGSLHRLLEAAGYPGRYEVEPEELFRRGFHVLWDRQTGVCYRALRPPRPPDEPRPGSLHDPLYAPDALLEAEEREAWAVDHAALARDRREGHRQAIDYGFIFHTAVNFVVPRRITIVAGTSSLGLWAATWALTEPAVWRQWSVPAGEAAPQPVEILVRVAVTPPALPFLDLEVAELAVVATSCGFRQQGEEVEALLGMFQGEVPSDEVGERFRALYEVTPHPEEEKYVIHVQPCTYPLEGPVWADGQPVALVGGPEMRDLLHQIQHLAEDDEPVLLTGPSGTGKELVARLIYGVRCQWLIEQGRLQEEELAGQAPFLPVNCGAIPGGLVEAELFGQVKGAFTDAAERLGLLRAAGEGVACLDEIGELDYALQSKLLRVLEERKVRPVGADREQPYAAKVVAMTNRDLLAEIRAQKFRADLHARFPHRLELPPLRDRRQDIPALILAYLHGRNPALRAVAVSEHALRVLLTEEYAESNVRTLQDGFLYALLVARHGQVDRIALSDLPWAWRERVGLTMDLEEDTWYEFRWAAAAEAEPLAVLQALKDQIDRCPRAELTAAHVWDLLERIGVRPVLEALHSDRGVKQAVVSMAPLARLGPKRNLMRPEERQHLLNHLRDHWNLSNANIALLFGVHRSRISSWLQGS